MKTETQTSDSVHLAGNREQAATVSESAEIMSGFDAAMGRIFGRELTAAQAAYEERRNYAERVAQAEAGLRDEFLALVKAGDLDAVAPFEQPLSDWRSRRADGSVPSRPATLLDVIEDAVDYQDFSRQLMGLFVRAANGSHVAEDARALMEKLATKYADMNAPEVE